MNEKRQKNQLSDEREKTKESIEPYIEITIPTYYQQKVDYTCRTKIHSNRWKSYVDT